MPRRNWYNLSRGRASSSLEENISLADVEKLFRDAEEKRHASFQTHLRVLEFDFLQAEMARDLPENQRDDEFNQLHLRTQEKFTADEKLRFNMFLEAEADQERVFRASEDKRALAFAAAQAIHTKIMEETVQHQHKENEYVVMTLTSMFSSGSRHREEASKNLYDRISFIFTTTLRSEQDCFFRAQEEQIKTLSAGGHKFDDAVKGTSFVFQDSQPEIQAYGDGADEPRFSWYDSDCGPSPPKQKQKSRLSKSKPSIPRSLPVPSLSSTAPSSTQPVSSPNGRVNEGQRTLMPMPLYSAMQRTRNDVTFDLVTSPPFLSPMVGEKHLPLSEVTSNDSGGRSRQQLLALLEVADQSFYENEARRDEVYNDILKSYAGRSEEAERERSLANHRREEQFRYTEQGIQVEFDSSLEYFSAEFQSKQESRKLDNDQRMNEVDSLGNLFGARMRQLEEAFLEQVKILVDTEQQAVADYKAPMARMIYKMENQILYTRQSFNDMFVNTLRKFGLQVSMPPIPPLGPFVEPETKEVNYVTTHVSSQATAGPLMEVDALHSEALFVPQTLLQGWSARLPILSVKPQLSREHPAPEVDAYLNAHEIYFLEAQSRRRAVAEEAFQAWQQIFAIQECKRQTDYRIQKMQQSEQTQIRENHKASRFLQSQRERAEAFRDSEAVRRDQFEGLIGELEGISFNFQLEDLGRIRDAKFSQARLTESERARDFKAWTIIEEAHFYSRAVAWRNDFMLDAERRRQVFTELMDSHSSMVLKPTSNGSVV